MLRVSLLNNKNEWKDAVGITGKRWINPTFIYLKDYYEYYSTYKDKVEWVIPTWQDLTFDEYVQWVLNSNLDVIGFGFYIWNAHRWVEVANSVRKKNPNILIIAGGPDIDFLDKEYAAMLEDSFDFVIKYDGEEPFRLLLDKLVENKPIQDIDGVYTIKDSTMIGQLDKVITRRTTWYQENSPILNNKQILKDAFTEGHTLGQEIMITWGTTRGCPYKCAFCDWGVSDYLKVGKKNPKISKRELTFLALNGVSGISLEDANWGMFNSDVDISVHWSRLYKRYNMLYRENASTSKNRKENVTKIIKIMAESGMLPRFAVGLQDLDPNVLKYNDRPDLTWEEHQEVLRELAKYNLGKTSTQAMLILGMPGQTLTTLIETFCKLGESKLFDDYAVNPFLMLPGAPMNMPVLRKKYNVKHTLGYLQDEKVISTARWEKDTSRVVFPVKFLTSCFSFSSKDYLEMIVMSNFITQFNIHFESVFDKGVDRRHFYTNFREISKQILGDFFTKTVAYLKYHFDNDYLHYHIESENFYLPLRDTSIVFLAIHKSDVTKYFKDEYDIDVQSNYKSFCTHYGFPTKVFFNYTPDQGIAIMKEIYNTVRRF